MNEKSGIRWKQKPFYSMGNGERTLEGADIVPITHAPSVEGAEADGKVSMDALAEMVHNDTVCLGSVQSVSKDDTIVVGQDKAVVADVKTVMCAEVPLIRPAHACIECADIQSLTSVCPITGNLSGTADKASCDACGCVIPDTYVRCSDKPVSCVSIADSGSERTVSVGYVGGTDETFTLDTRAVLECDSVPDIPGDRVYNVGAKVYSKDVELTTRKDFDALSVNCIHNDDCSACIATLGGSNQVKGSTSIAGDLSVSGNIYQRGETYTTHAEELNVGSSTVTVRADAESAMTPGDYAGIVVCRYDGTNDMNVFVDSEGTARLGKLTSLQPFALRNEAANMTDGALVCWNAADKRIDTACSIDCYTRNLVNKVEKSGTGISYTDVQGCSYNVEITNLKGDSARVSVSDSGVSLCYEADTPHELTLDNEGLRLDGKGLGQGGIVPDAELNHSSFGVLTHCDISPFCVYQCVSRCNGVAIGTMQWLDADSVCVGGHCVTGAGYIMTGSGKPFCSWSHVEALFLGNGSVYFNSYRNGASEGDGTNVKVSRPLAQVESWDGSTLCLRG